MKRKKFKINPWLLLIVVLAVAAVFYFFFLKKEDTPYARAYFLKEESLFEARRPLLPDDEVLSKTAEILLLGPNKKEVSRGIFSEIPKETRIIKLKKDGKILEATFSKELSSYGGGSARLRGLIAQIVYSFTGINGIERVKIKIQGEDETVLGGEGFVIDAPLSRGDAAF